MFHPHAIEPAVAPIPAPNSILVLLVFLTALIPRFQTPAAPIPINAVGLVKAVAAPAANFNKG